MSTSQHTAEVVIKGKTDGVGAKLKEVEDGTNKVKKAAEAAGVAQEAWGDKLDKIDAKMKGFTDGIGKVTGLLGAGGLVAMVTGAASAFGEMANHAAKLSAANQALRISLDAARTATMGLVSDYRLTISANKAVQLGIVATDHEFAKLANTAVRLGAAVGQDAAESIEKLTDALDKGSADALRELGVVVDTEHAYQLYAAQIGKTADALTDLEKKRAIVVEGLEEAELAADKSGVALEGRAQKWAALTTKWENFYDSATGAAMDGLIAFDEWNEAAAKAEMDALGYTALLEERTRGQTVAAQELGGVTLELLQRFDAMTGATDAWRVASDGLSAALAKQTAEQETLANIATIDAFLKGRIDKQKAPTKPKGRPKKEETVYNQSRSISLEASFGATNDIADTPLIEARTDAMAREIEMREDRIALLEHEMELAQMQVDAGLMETDQVEEMARRKHEAEQDLLDFQLEAAYTREEIADLEMQKRRAATRETQRLAVVAQQAEIKSLSERRQKYEGFAVQVGDALGAVAIAGIAAAEGQEYAGRKAVAAIATSIRDQMVITSLKEFALAIASAASFNFPGAAAHAAAGVQAGVVAGVAAGLGAGVSATIPSPPAVSGPSRSPSPGAGAGAGGAGGGGGGGGGDDDGVPTSYADGALYTRRPARTPDASKSAGGVVVNINAGVVAGDAEKTGLALKRLIDTANRSQGAVR